METLDKILTRGTDRKVCLGINLKEINMNLYNKQFHSIKRALLPMVRNRTLNEISSINFRQFYELYRQRMNERVKCFKDMTPEKQQEMIKLYGSQRLLSKI